MFGNKIKLSMTHDEIRVLVYALNELKMLSLKKADIQTRSMNCL